MVFCGISLSLAIECKADTAQQSHRPAYCLSFQTVIEITKTIAASGIQYWNVMPQTVKSSVKKCR
jgi:hypothetical protein